MTDSPLRFEKKKSLVSHSLLVRQAQSRLSMKRQWRLSMRHTAPILTKAALLLLHHCTF
jgi:hypothetical protein